MVHLPGREGNRPFCINGKLRGEDIIIIVKTIILVIPVFLSIIKVVIDRSELGSGHGRIEEAFNFFVNLIRRGYFLFCSKRRRL